MRNESRLVIPPEVHTAALVDLSRPQTRVFQLLRAEVELFPATLGVLADRVVSSDLQSKEELVATGTQVIKKLLVTHWTATQETQVQGIMEGLWSVERWENYRHIGGPENSLQHSLRDLHLVCLLSDLEVKEGRRPDIGFLLRAFILHDVGEIGLGDTLYKDKTLLREREEYLRFCQLISFLSPEEQRKWVTYYLAQYIRFSPVVNRERFKGLKPSPLPTLVELQAKYGIEGKIFDAAERIGYLLYAIHCFVDRYQIEPLIQVLRNQHPHLVRLSSELPSIGKYLYTQEVIMWAEVLLKRYEGLYEEKQFL